MSDSAEPKGAKGVDPDRYIGLLRASQSAECAKVCTALILEAHGPDKFWESGIVGVLMELTRRAISFQATSGRTNPAPVEGCIEVIYRNLTKIPPPKDVGPDLALLLKHPSGTVRGQVAIMLSRIEGCPPKTVEAMIGQLNDGDPGAFYQVVLALVALKAEPMVVAEIICDRASEAWAKHTGYSLDSWLQTCASSLSEYAAFAEVRRLPRVRGALLRLAYSKAADSSAREALEAFAKAEPDPAAAE